MDAELCEGCGLCPEICPEVFGMASSDGGKIAYVKDENVAEEYDTRCREAADRCPVEAIRVDQDL